MRDAVTRSQQKQQGFQGGQRDHFVACVCVPSFCCLQQGSLTPSVLATNLSLLHWQNSMRQNSFKKMIYHWLIVHIYSHRLHCEIAVRMLTCSLKCFKWSSTLSHSDVCKANLLDVERKIILSLYFWKKVFLSKVLSCNKHVKNNITGYNFFQSSVIALDYLGGLKGAKKAMKVELERPSLNRAWGYRTNCQPSIMQSSVFSPHSHLNDASPKHSQPHQSCYTYSALYSPPVGLWENQKYHLPLFSTSMPWPEWLIISIDMFFYSLCI